MEAGEAADFIPEPTKAESGKIKPIDGETVHKICSGQVVLSLAVAVKELVENAIDAGATLVEVKLREQGLESVEVIDNGHGVPECNLEGMTAKYYTSKITKFDDLLGVESFGFRGEALSSLCGLSKVTITTRHKDTELATKIELDHDGNIVSRSPCSRPIGTTVFLSQLFCTLPVRKRDFAKNIKKEFTKMCQMLQGYCLGAQGVRLICSNHTAKGGKTVVFQTQGTKDILANITSIFGVRQSADLLPLKPAFEADALLTKERLLEDSVGSNDSMQITNDDVERLKANPFKIEGYISSCSHGAGRSSKDRQFFYVNSRPCDHKSIAKVVNDVYHRFNSHQYPFVFLNVITARADVDVNLTPDKRQLLVKNEKILLLIIKKSLLNTFENIPGQLKLQNPTITSMFQTKPNIEKEKESPNDSKKEETLIDEESKGDCESLVPISTSQKFMDVLSQWRRTGDTQGHAPSKRVTNSKRKGSNEIEVRTVKMQKIQEYLSREVPLSKQEKQKTSYVSESDSETEETPSSAEKQSPNSSLINIDKLNEASKDYDLVTSTDTVKRIDCKVAAPAKPFFTFLKGITKRRESEGDSLPSTQESFVSYLTEEKDQASTQEAEDCEKSLEMPSQSIIELDDDSAETQEPPDSITCITIKTSLEEIATSLAAEDQFRRERKSKPKLERLRFKSRIAPNENQTAEAELQTEISKDDFARMEIIGQFNLGFIITKLDDDLFIVDQHATDEKYNFETLQKTTVIQSQLLAVPQPLDLTIVNEMVLLDHLDVFEKNGFKFQINESAPAGQKVRLVSKPFSKNWEFGKEDIDELIFMLQDAPEGTICRPSRIKTMFASRACRSSVMIGKTLTKKAMETLIRHMGEIEQPWNCPHGRPTCRHLINLAMLADSDDEEEKSDTEI